ncbi:DNA cross-link repair protein pso2/snm1 [Cladobotryum mycophilum]|uniref:DNA cross-link repair protein pso2/snm1 n=1 Tax=Cladobotryum mycophilum TaxID=491253 RepID=A0ABR0SF72_9HYPO
MPSYMHFKHMTKPNLATEFLYHVTSRYPMPTTKRGPDVSHFSTLLATGAEKTAASNKKPTKIINGNASILNFFQKAPKPEDSLFVGASSAPTPVTQEDDLYSRDDEPRYNENGSPTKKRRLSEDRHISAAEEVAIEKSILENASNGVSEPVTKKMKPKIKTPFVMDSDSEDEEQDEGRKRPTKTEAPLKTEAEPSDETSDKDIDIKYEPPPLKKENSSFVQVDELEDFADLEGFDIGDFEGEETREMRFMHEQARLEAEEVGFSSEDFGDDPLDDQSPIENCPICNGSLVGISTNDATRHVNGCLDGNPIPIPTTDSKEAKDIPEVEAEEISKRFARAAVPRPGQANPFDIDTKKVDTVSAFSKLMSGNAEDSAWNTAAAAENASRGRPAYERTCPFYKIMPGFSICVDAFRYGAVEGCKAYFLSHFHSDHYIGLTANWRHGPIYCSKVTGSLIKQQLRTAAKWVVELEFEKSYDIPGTEGASVTMIPANHCPGSSLFLFRKPFGTGSSQKTKRILHCGDFRACPDHVRHPLLKPDVVDAVSGKLRQQKIDLCYLDTTYLNPRYSFPPQGDVIKACADLCGSMSPDPSSKDDALLKGERTTGTDSVSKYFQSTKTPEKDGQPQRKGSAKQRLLVICGTYSIGKERICVAIAKALKSKIFASPAKIKICKQLDDPELSSLLTSNPVEAQVHMQMLMEIRAETLQEYLDSYKPHFSRIIGFRPSGWNFKQANGKPVSPNTPPSTLYTDKVLHAPTWRTRFGINDLVAQRGSTNEAMCFGVPYSEHSSFRELTMFVLSLRIEKVIPTVNVGSEQSRKRMKGWIDKWMMERRKEGLMRPLIEGEDKSDGSNELWGTCKSGKGGGAWW